MSIKSQFDINKYLNNIISRKQPVVKKSFSGEKSILKLTLLCAILIGSTCFNSTVFASQIDINNNSDSENGINNNSYYVSGNTLNITNSIKTENNLPEIYNLENFIINGTEADKLLIDGSNTSTGYFIDKSVLTIKNLTFSNFINSLDSSEVYGTAFFINWDSTDNPSILTLDNISLSGNSLKNTELQAGSPKSYFGGAIANNATLNLKSSNIEANTIYANNGESANGGAIYNTGVLNSTNTNFESNSISSVDGATRGGAVSNIGTSTIQNGEFNKNSAKSVENNAQGGAIYNNGTLDISNTTFSQNSTQTDENGNAQGGTIYNNGTLNISNTTFSQNSTQTNGKGDAQGGAIYNNGTLNISNTTFSQNSTQANGEGNAHGGAIYTTADIVLQGGNTFNAPSNDIISNDIYLAGGNIIVNNIANTEKANIISSGISSYDTTSSIIIEDNGKLILNGDNTGFKGNASVGADSTLLYSGDPEKSILSSTIINGNNGSIEFNFDNNYTLQAGKVTTDTGINGKFIQSGTGTLTLTNGDYSNFNGEVIINSGMISYIQDELETEYISSTSNTINTGAVLRYENSITDASIQNLKGAGNFEKAGIGTLNLTGDNSKFNGKLLITEGSLIYTNNNGYKYINGETIINKDSQLNITTNENTTDSIGDISGTGSFNKNGNGTLNLDGENSNFTGNVAINEGTLSYNSTNGNVFI